MAELGGLPQTWDEARGRLLGRIYGADQFGVDILEAVAEGAESGISAAIDLSSDLLFGLLVASDESWVRVSEGMVASWDVTVGELIDELLVTDPGEKLSAAQPATGRFMVQHPVFSWLIWLSPPTAKLFPVEGETTLWAVTDGLTVVTGSDDATALDFVTNVITSCREAGRRIESVLPHRWDGNAWVAQQLPVTDNWLGDTVIRAQLQSVYERQAAPLATFLASRDPGTVVVDYNAMRSPNGEAVAYATWTEGAAAVLPVADSVVLVSADGTSVLVPWANALAEFSDLLEPLDGVRPARYLTHGWPDAEARARALR